MSPDPDFATRERTAFAPATVANVAVGFDVLGFALEGVGDRVTVAHEQDSDGIVVEILDGVVTDLPVDPAKNTASVAVAAMLTGRWEGRGLRISIAKGIPLGSGMGGSAASAVAAVVATNGLLARPLATDELLPFAMAGEAAASGAPHADNAAPCLYGGMTAVVAAHPPRVVGVPVPSGLLCILAHPHLKIETRAARAALPESVALGTHVEQSMRLAGFLTGMYRGDFRLIGNSLIDLVAEPSRSKLIPGFASARSAALGAGSLGFGISGSGPSVFALADDPAVAGRVEKAVAAAFEAEGLEVDLWTGPIRQEGAAVTGDGS